MQFHRVTPVNGNKGCSAPLLINVPHCGTANCRSCLTFSVIFIKRLHLKESVTGYCILLFDRPPLSFGFPLREIIRRQSFKFCIEYIMISLILCVGRFAFQKETSETADTCITYNIKLLKIQDNSPTTTPTLPSPSPHPASRQSSVTLCSLLHPYRVSGLVQALYKRRVWGFHSVTVSRPHHIPHIRPFLYTSSFRLHYKGSWCRRSGLLSLPPSPSHAI